MEPLHYRLWDVLADFAFSGNQLAVIPDGDRVAPDTMQPIANEFSLSESVFLMSPANASFQFRIRIFTPQRDLPMAGHPAIGAACALARLGRLSTGPYTSPGTEALSSLHG